MQNGEKYFFSNCIILIKSPIYNSILITSLPQVNNMYVTATITPYDTWLFLFSGICMSIGILCFPAGWDNDHVRGICGASADDYVLGNCGIR